MFEPYLMGQYQYPWQGMSPTPNWRPQTPQVAQGQQGIQGVRFVDGIEEAKNCTIPLGSKALLMDKEKDRFYLKETDTTGVSTVSEFEFKKVEAETPRSMSLVRSSNNSQHNCQRTKTMDCMTEVKVLVDSHK